MTLRVGAPSYINTFPFLAKWLLDPAASLVKWETAPPVETNRRMAEGQFDAAFVSSAHYLANKDNYRLIPGFGIGAEKAVKSVSLFHKFPLHSLGEQQIALDPESETSNRLLLWLAKNVWRLKLSPVSLSENVDQKTAGYLLIGDRCLMHTPANGFVSTDLCTAWYEATKMPFPFAVLVAKKELTPAQEHTLFRSIEEGLTWFHSHLNETVSLAKTSCALSSAELAEYWSLLKYRFDHRYQQALALFT